MKLIEILKDLIFEVKSKGQYDVKSLSDENLLETYLLLGELLDPNNAYPYESYHGIHHFKDLSGITFCARLVYQPTAEPFWEFKTWWVNEQGKATYHYLPDQSTAVDWDKRSDTVAKIFRDEVIPLFKSQNSSNVMKILPLDSKRYQFSLRMVKKFIPSEWKIEEQFPKAIRIIK